ncbi:MAG: hypothetical protein AAFY15_15225, partial [Cyanobacteria bacterium J06648_11]
SFADAVGVLRMTYNLIEALQMSGTLNSSCTASQARPSDEDRRDPLLNLPRRCDHPFDALPI